MTIKMDADETAGFHLLREVLPEDLALDIVKHRRRKKAHLTARVAKSLVREYRAFGNPERAAEIHLTRAWTSFECEWVKRAQGFTDQNHPTPRPTANYGSPKPANDEPASATVDPERRRQLAEMARNAARGMRAN